MPYCNTCGARYRNGSSFCSECGNALFALTAPHLACWEGAPPLFLHEDAAAYGRPAPPPKNVGLALLLTTLFGPLGLLYTSVAGALYMLLGWCFLVLATCDDWIANDAIPMLIIWPVCILWAALTACSYNHNRR
jgi:hypothetical protein